MFESRTLFIVGAGASFEIGLPVGAMLTEHIAGVLGPTNYIPGSLHYLNRVPRPMMVAFNHLIRTVPGVTQTKLEAACHRIDVAMPVVPSIDNFIDLHADDFAVEAVGKLAIAYCILKAEAGSKLVFDRSNIFHRLPLTQAAGTWFQRLMRLASEGGRAKNPSSILGNLNFIVFNYDRAIEHFLLQAVQQILGVEPAVANAMLQVVPIRHPYGTVGCLPGWEGGITVEYGTDPGRVKLFEVMQCLQTFTERVVDGDVLRDMHGMIQGAETIVFLGFGFNAQNMELIRQRSPILAKRVFATGLGMSKSDTNVVRNQIHETLNLTFPAAEVVVEDTTCCGLFDAYSRSLPAKA